MRHLLIILTFFLSQAAFGYVKNIDVNLYNENDTSLYFKVSAELAKQIKLDKIQCSSSKFYFRLWTVNQVIEVWETLEGNHEGKITSWTKEAVPYGEEPTNRVFYRINKMDSLQVFDTFTLINSSGIQNVQDESLIKGWKQGFDGIIYIIESSNSTDYSFKSYWTPTAQDSLKEAIIVQNFVDRAREITGSSILWNQFAKDIPFECNINGGPSISCKILTKGERRKYKKERENFRQLQLPCKSGSGGFRWASFRSVPLNRDNPHLRVASYPGCPGYM